MTISRGLPGARSPRSKGLNSNRRLNQRGCMPERSRYFVCVSMRRKPRTPAKQTRPVLGIKFLAQRHKDSKPSKTASDGPATAPASPAPLSRSSLLRNSSFIRAVCVDALVRICAGCALKAHGTQSPEMEVAAKPSSQPRTKSCVVSGGVTVGHLSRKLFTKETNERVRHRNIKTPRLIASGPLCV